MKKTVLLLCAFLSLISKIFSQDSLQSFPTPLDLQIISIDAKLISKNVQLTWRISNNENAKSFEVERSENGEDFKKIGGKLSLGRPGTESYEFVDPLLKQHIVFDYRIKIIGKDGSFLYSDMRTIKVEEKELQCKLKQNPVRNSIELEITSSQAENLKTAVYTAYGQKVIAENAKLTSGTNSIAISSQNLLPGIHRLVLETSNERKVISFVKE